MSYYFSNYTRDLFELWHNGVIGDVNKVLWEWTLPHVCWGVLKEKNNIIIREKETNAKVFFHKILNALLENYNINKDYSSLLNTKEIDRNMRENCRWTILLQVWCKENFVYICDS